MKLNSELYKINDPVYLDEEIYNNPKEYFKFLGELIKNRFQNKPASVIDIGCASGDFLYYLCNHINIKKATGVDVSDKHLSLAKKKMPNINFINSSVFKLVSADLPKYDICFFLGVMPIFDNITSILQILISIIKKTGTIYILDSINDDPVDMLMRYKLSSENSDWKSGFNIRSKMSYKRILKKIDPKLKYRFYPFNINFSIKKTNDPMRAWTIRTNENKYQQVVGTGQMLNPTILEISY